MMKARDGGVLLHGEADYQLHWIYLWYEKKPAAALNLLRRLDARYPANPVFLQRIAEVHNQYLHDHAAAAAAWELLLARAQRGQTESASTVQTRARLGLSAELIALSHPERAIDHLESIVTSGASAPYGAQALAQLQLGNAYEGIGRRDLAADAYTRAIARAPSGDPARVRDRARAALVALTRRK
jgi:hypothetical protein